MVLRLWRSRRSKYAAASVALKHRQVLVAIAGAGGQETLGQERRQLLVFAGVICQACRGDDPLL